MNGMYLYMAAFFLSEVGVHYADAKLARYLHETYGHQLESWGRGYSVRGIRRARKFKDPKVTRMVRWSLILHRISLGIVLCGVMVLLALIALVWWGRAASTP